MPITKENSRNLFTPDAICFRAWNTNSKRFVVILYVDFLKRHVIFKHSKKEIMLSEKIGNIEFDRFTSLYDTYMVKIYENDIISDGFKCWSIEYWNGAFYVSTGILLGKFLNTGNYFRCGHMRKYNDKFIIERKYKEDGGWEQ